MMRALNGMALRTLEAVAALTAGAAAVCVAVVVLGIAVAMLIVFGAAEKQP